MLPRNLVSLRNHKLTINRCIYNKYASSVGQQKEKAHIPVLLKEVTKYYEHLKLKVIKF